MHHLYPKSKGCPDTLIVPLCYRCHRNAHGLKANINHSELTRQGLLAAKARGTKLGWGQRQRDRAVHMAAVAKGAARGAASTAEAADSFAAKILPIVRPLAEAGQSLRQIAAALNNQGISTPRGKEWQAASVKNLLSRNYHV